MTHHGNEAEHRNEHHPSPDEPVGGTLGTTGTEGNGMPEQVVGDELHTDERAQTAEESVSRGTIGGQAPGGLGTTGLGEDQPGGGMSPNSAGVPGDQVTSVGGVSADPLDGSNATGGYGDESTGLSDATDRDPGEDATDVNGGNADR